MKYLALKGGFRIRGRSVPFPTWRRKEPQDSDVILFQWTIFIRSRVEKRRTRVARIHVSSNKHALQNHQRPAEVSSEKERLRIRFIHKVVQDQKAPSQA